MMMLNILLLSIFQSVFVITLNENKKLTCDKKEGQLQLIGQSPVANDDEVYDETVNCLRANMILKCRHNISSTKKKVYYFLKRVYSLFHVFMILYKVVKLIGLLQGKKKKQRQCLEKTK